jgi:hypothetical protein
MNQEAQRIAIAEACGWTAKQNLGAAGGYCARSPKGESCDYMLGGTHADAIEANCPDYTADLNAMHEAEKVLTPDEKWDYMDEIDRMTERVPYFCTAAQRAEAFLRTIGKWEEEEA